MTTGAGSSFPIMRLAAKVNEAQKNGQLLSNRHAVEIIDMRILQLAERVDVDDVPERALKLCALWKELNETENSAEQMKIRSRLDKEFDKVYHDYMAWNQIYESLDLRRKMIESEVKILKEIRGVISAEDAYEMTAKLLAATIRVIGEDPKKLKQVQYEYARIIGEASDNIDNITEGLVEDDGGSGG